MKLADLVIEMGKVQTDRDNPPFKTPKQIEREKLRVQKIMKEMIEDDFHEIT